MVLHTGQEKQQFVVFHSTYATLRSHSNEHTTDILAYGAAESIAMILDPVAQQNGLGSMTLQRWQELLKQMVYHWPNQRGCGERHNGLHQPLLALAWLE